MEGSSFAMACAHASSVLLSKNFSKEVVKDALIVTSNIKSQPLRNGYFTSPKPEGTNVEKQDSEFRSPQFRRKEKTKNRLQPYPLLYSELRTPEFCFPMAFCARFCL